MWVILWIGLSILAGNIAGNKGRSGGGFFLLSLLLSPLIGLIAALVAQPNLLALEAKALQSGGGKKCPHCAEMVKAEARICRYCGQELPPGPSRQALLAEKKAEEDRGNKKAALAILGIVVFIMLCGVVVYFLEPSPSNARQTRSVTSRPTATATHRPSPTPTPALVRTVTPKLILVPTPAPYIARYPVNAVGNLRGGPGTEYSIMGQVAPRQTVVIIASNGAGDWYQLDNGKWIAAFLIDNAPANLPVARGQ